MFLLSAFPFFQGMPLFLKGSGDNSHAASVRGLIESMETEVAAQ